MKDEGPCEHTQKTEAIGLGCPMGNAAWKVHADTAVEN